MSDRPRTYAEAVAARKRSLIETLAELDITLDEASLFIVIQYGIGAHPESLPRHAAADEYRLDDSASEVGCQAALADCLAKGWLQVLDDAALADIAALLKAGNIIGPVYRLPHVGRVDFTQAGANRWFRIRDRDGPAEPFAFTDVVREMTARYFTTRAAAEAEAEWARGEEETAAVSDPTPTGPWRAQWWRRFAQGYRIDIEERRRWQGRCSRGGEECDLTRDPDRADPVRLRCVLDARNVTLAEYAVLAEMDWRPRRFDDHEFASMAHYADRDFGSPLTEAECRAGLDACPRYGWLRVLDAAAIGEIRALVRNESATLALPRTAELRPDGHGLACDPARPYGTVPVPAKERWGETDFTPTGAALYRAISAAWLGDDWEDGLSVSNGYFREEHRYCVAESGFRDIATAYEAEGRVVRCLRVVPIGPWCVYWWEQYPAGFRHELEVTGDVGS